jgi:hypothetical protein
VVLESSSSCSPKDHGIDPIINRNSTISVSFWTKGNSSKSRLEPQLPIASLRKCPLCPLSEMKDLNRRICGVQAMKMGWQLLEVFQHSELLFSINKVSACKPACIKMRIQNFSWTCRVRMAADRRKVLTGQLKEDGPRKSQWPGSTFPFAHLWLGSWPASGERTSSGKAERSFNSFEVANRMWPSTSLPKQTLAFGPRCCVNGRSNWLAPPPQAPDW